MGIGDLTDHSPGSLREAAGRLFVQSFPLFLMDAVRRAHPIAPSQFHLVGTDSSRLAPGLFEDDPRVIISSAWIDLSAGPMVLRVPHMHGRHFSLAVIDSAGHCFLSLGSRTGDDSGLELVLAGPKWIGEVRRGLRARRSTSECCWAVSRVWAHSMLDRADAIAVAGRLSLAPLQNGPDWGQAAGALLEPFPTSCVRQVLEITPELFFQRLGTVLDRAPVVPHRAHRDTIARLKPWVGSLNSSRWSPEMAPDLAKGFADGAAAIQASVTEVYMEQGAGWRTPAPPADPEVETPLAHAARVYETLGSLPREDLMTLVCTHDQTGRVLSGGSAYRIRLAEAAMPPVNGFWQIYARPAAGPQYRTGIGSRNDLLLNVDGSLELTIQHPLPEAAGISNWLPSPEGEMALVMRLHSPRPAGVEGAWRMPAIERLDPWTRQRRSPRRGRAPTPRSSSSNELAPPGAAKEKVP